MEDPKLFNTEELEQQQPTELQEPVICLGMEFANDEERRAYFREELRKKLPELRSIEGFPIGEDEDIIALSDPPYYTACPNPWLNDFIAEWEKDKVQLIAEGKRVREKIITEPYASDVSVGKNNPIYNAHSYHTKVPHPAIMRYILHYTEPGDIVFDGFGGTGMTGVAAAQCDHPDRDTKSSIEKDFGTLGHKISWGRRRSICGDLSPYASFIAYNYNAPIDSSWFVREANKIIDEVEKELGWMYETKHRDGRKGKISFVVWSDVFTCPYCGKEIVYYNEGVDDENKEIRDEFPCPHCGALLTKKSLLRYKSSIYDAALGKSIVQTKAVPVLIKYSTSDGKRYEKKPDKDDLGLISRIESLDCPYWFPTDKMMGKDGRWGEQWRSFHEGLNNVHHFFTARNRYVAAAIYARTRGKGALNVMMTSFLVNIGSKLARYKMGKSGNANMPGTLYVASATAEQNLFSGYKGKIKDFASIYSKQNKGIVNVSSASACVLANNSIDYIFTDPPFGDNIMYSELNFIQECWLKVRTHNEEEAIVSSFYHKGVPEYQLLMEKCFIEYYRILKPGHWMTVEFSNTRASVWNSIQTALANAGFVIANAASIDKQQASYNAVTSTTAVKQDIVLTCYKPTDRVTSAFESQPSLESMWTFLDEHLQHLPVHIVRNNSTTSVIERSPKILYDRVVAYYVQHGYPVPMDAAEFQAGLRSRYIERDGMFFTAQQAAEYEEKRKTTTDFVPMGLLIGGEADGIAWLRRELETPQTYQDLQPKWMQALTKQRKGDMQIEMRTLLEENFIEEPDGKWRLPDPEEEADREKLRIKGLMREFTAYVEQAAKPKSKLKQVRLEALREGFKQCWQQKAFETIVNVGDKIPEEMLQEDEVLLRYYDIASRRVL